MADNPLHIAIGLQQKEDCGGEEHFTSLLALRQEQDSGGEEVHGDSEDTDGQGKPRGWNSTTVNNPRAADDGVSSIVEMLAETATPPQLRIESVNKKEEEKEEARSVRKDANAIATITMATQANIAAVAHCLPNGDCMMRKEN